MTSDRRAALVKKVANLINSMTYFWSMDLSLRQAEKTANAAIDLIRADVLEEAAELVEQHTPRYGEGDFRGYLVRRMAYDSIGLPYAAAIRALKAAP
jgi:hypothetical protein